jgi:uncharacterized protein YcfL
MTRKTLPAIILSLSLMALAGCASPSVIVLNDGREITALDTPKLDAKAGYYEFKALDGKRARLNQDQVQGVKQL